MVVPPWFKVPPERYGGIEAVVSLLTDGLVDRKHEVTLFTITGAKTKARVFKIFDEEMKSFLDGPPSSFLNVALTHALTSYFEIFKGDYDIVHDHTWKEGLSCAAFMDIPIVHTIHCPIDEENMRFYGLFKGLPGLHFVTISNFQRTHLPGLNYAGTVYNAIDFHRYPYSEDKEDFLLYLGRFNSEKAPHLACEVAKKLEQRFILAGKVGEKAERNYFDRYIKPYLNDNIEYLGEVSEEKKMELFSKARGYLFSIQWDEPFGITMAEAQACGTPVVTFRRGAVPEVVEHGVTGYVVDTMDELVDAVERVDDIDPKKCRERAERMFRPEVMIEAYERIYSKILESSERT